MQITPITPMSPYFKGFKNLEKQQAEKDQYDREQIEIYKQIKKEAHRTAAYATALILPVCIVAYSNSNKKSNETIPAEIQIEQKQQSVNVQTAKDSLQLFSNKKASQE